MATETLAKPVALTGVQSITETDIENIESYTPKQGVWHLMQGKSAKESIALEKDFIIPFSGIVGIEVIQKESKEYGKAEYLKVGFKKQITDSSSVPYFNINIVITPMVMRDKDTEDRILDENGNPKMICSFTALTMCNALLSYSAAEEDVRNLQGALGVHGRVTSFVDAYFLNPVTQKYYRRSIARELDNCRDPLDIQGAIAEVQHSNGFPVGPYPLPVVS